MSQSPTTSVENPLEKPKVVEDTEPSVVQEAKAQPPVFMTEQEVVLSTAAALSRPPSISRRLFNAIRVVGAALQPPPPKKHLPQRSSYLEHARMAREMDRL